MGKGLILAWALALAGAAAAGDVETIRMTDGPNGGGRLLGAAWKMACPAGERIAGLAVHEAADRIVSVEPLCVRLEGRGQALAWAVPPESPARRERAEPEAPTVTAYDTPDERSDGRILRARSSEVARFSGSRAMLISVSREGSMTRSGRPGSTMLQVGPAPREILCESGAYVRGLRTGTTARGELAAIQLVCQRPGSRTSLAGAWPQGGVVKLEGRKRPERLTEARIQCGGGGRNPHDGQAARMLIGTAEYGRVQSLGLACARAGKPGPVASAAISSLRWLDEVTPQKPTIVRARVYQTPRWYAGSEVAVCRDGSGRGFCAQAAADRFCTAMGEFTSAAFYIVGGYSEDAIAEGGKRCPAGACRAFRQITCSS